MQDSLALVNHPATAQLDPPARLRLVACIGAQWPAELVSRPVKSLEPARVLQKLSGNKRRPIWMGYISPVDLLISQQPSTASSLEHLLDTWLEHTVIFLQARELEPSDTRLFNLSHLDSDSADRPAAAPAELPLPLQLYLQRRHDVLHRYADLEGQAELLGRQPQFALPVVNLSNSDWQALLLQAWEAEVRLPELLSTQKALQEEVLQREPLQAELHTAREQLTEAREEAELTLLQLHQVQEELEHYFLRCRTSDQQAATQVEALQQAEASGQEQGARLLALEAEVIQLRSERDEAAHGREQQGRNVDDLQQQLSSKAEVYTLVQGQLTEAREEAELTLLQLHQVQEELEHYFLRSRSSDQLVAAQAEQNGRAFSLLGRMLQLSTPSGPWLSEPQLAPPSSRSKRSRLRWGR
jgi:hypothetical protein